jgi:hypothetical protein
MFFIWIDKHSSLVISLLCQFAKKILFKLSDWPIATIPTSSKLLSKGTRRCQLSLLGGWCSWHKSPSSLQLSPGMLQKFP